MPASLKEILQELDTLLTPANFEDYCPNGLQVPGTNQVTTLATAVSAHLALFQRAREHNAELILTHHGILWGSGGPPPPIDPPTKRRLKLLFDADISLAAYHLPLDAHPELGNNALLARALGADQPLHPFAPHKGRPIGFIAHFETAATPATPAGLPATDLFTRIERLTNRTPLVFDSGPEHIRTLAIVSGAGADYLPEAIAAGADAFLTGEPAERVMAQAHEANIHFIAAGHYATEILGIQRLGEHLAERFALRHIFIDIPNPV
jgi:dinuclear metal center YbgI/SA1388 family protein